ncbi:N-acetylmuramoyl-L-alanine amidase [Patulibacter sp. NPDC049589]|uniref:N-acetylmuramoyl-L-alanine amidase n=1 Tax=Patulibacter sp. NPDC049589 TaxID=3154731 RepID=UPI0034190446
MSGRVGSLALVLLVVAVLGVGAGAVLALSSGDDDPARAAVPAATSGGTAAASPREEAPRAGSATPATSTRATGGTGATTTAGDLAGRTVVIDPGHNGANGSHPTEINRLVDAGNGRKACNTTGTESNGGLAESRLNWLLAQHVRRALVARGAHVVLTRRGDDGVGPCVDRRARIANAANADAAVSIHGDGGPPGGRGFHVILPGAVPQVAGHSRIVATSARLGRAVRGAYRSGAGMPYSTYLGSAGLDVRTDLGGLNLLTVPGVMIETGNMRNATDAALMADSAWRRRAGRAIATGIGRYLRAVR